jgi:P27 family predicted phage terminase small subunit
MGERGPKARPNHLKAIAGVEERYLNRDEPVPAESVVVPGPMSEGGRSVWDRLAPDLIDKKMLTAWDVDTFAVFCEAVATYHHNRELMGDQYTARGSAGGVIKSPHWQIMRDCSAIMAQYSSRFGMTPGDRAGLKVEGDTTPKSGGERLLG